MFKKDLSKSIVGKRQIFRRVQSHIHNILNDMNESVNNTNINTESIENQNHNVTIEAVEVDKQCPLDCNVPEPSNLLETENVIRNIQTENFVILDDEHEQYNNYNELQSSCSNLVEQNVQAHFSSATCSNLSEQKPVGSLNTNLAHWAIESNVPKETVTKLLRILHPYHQELPLDSRSLLKTPRIYKIKHLETGSYSHIGLVCGLTRCLKIQNSLDCENNILKLSFNIDGIPLFKSSSLQFWPILCKISNRNNFSPFTVGIFCGVSKPSPLHSYLEDFLNDLTILLKEGFIFRNTVYSVEIENFICDAPARAYIKCIKSHGGYSSCDKCEEEGDYDYVGRTVILKGISAPLRTDSSFRSKRDPDHHLGESPLLKLPRLDVVSDFPIDYMHSVCLGVTRKLLHSWTSGSLHVRLSSQQVKLLSERILLLRVSTPTEINRKPRELSELARWKATEFRTFLLYIGPVVLKGIVDIAIYEHFLLLSCAISILVSNTRITKIHDLANEYLSMFVIHCEKIYGRQFYVYNVHTLCHLSNDVKRFGALDSYSAFPFENYLGKLKSLIKSPQRPLEQIIRRLFEIDHIDNVDSTTIENTKCLMEHHNGPLTFGISVCSQFKKLSLKNCILSIFSYNSSDSYCITKENYVVQIHNILKVNNKILILGKKYNEYDSFFTYPQNSKDLNIYCLNKLSTTLELWNIYDIVTKCWVFTRTDDIVVSYPLLHTV